MACVEEDAVLDLTSSQLHDLSDVNLPPGLVELDLTANRLSFLDQRMQHLSRLKKLSLRQNLLADDAVQALGEWPSLFGLQELVLRDNKLTRLPPVGGLSELVVFDVSFNELTSLDGMNKVCSKLRELYLSKNEIVKMEQLEHMQELRLLELGSNRIRVLEGIENMKRLEELWLGRNRIRTVNLCGLTSIVKLSLQNNRLTSMLGFEECLALEELYLSHNGISKMEGLATLVNLRVLDVSSNRLTSIADVENLEKLEDLWLNDNNIPSLDGIETILSGPRQSLSTIYLERNPCASDSSYVNKLIAALPKLGQIDSRVL
ncbi:hypothetical protein SELMODRAFT_187027 [Selaginella moellendorffii]|uniref:Protein phosphatase 1 regulatory subunit 7 n=1 Tax=Selaginella moellendorffii TaxID=88036 RepID=D8TB56_SELML|nr:protein phosphatase 1 regulatory inhibitor subunit PPP1R7 homolog [Selaginella moellendorffii]EFJ06124.1 hypothetical protein SELMODRAFT_187027 [Selaginella moellendorffii]|eukprot:XP_002992834.1 protein phosphatase 1 regulatory inhibitor subunit PPP1R7 homolog [Selaginella moellendorffii]